MPHRPNRPSADRRSHRLLALVAASLVGHGALAGAQASGAPASGVPADRGVTSRVDSTLAGVTFDSAWRRVRDSYYDPAMRGVDWEAVRDDLRPQALAATSPDALRDVLRRMIGRLGESHFAILPGVAADAVETRRALDPAGARAPGDLGLALRIVDGRLAVIEVEPGGPAARAGVRPGWTVEVADGDSVAPALRTLAAAGDAAARRELLLRLPLRVSAALGGPAGDTVVVGFRDGRDRPTSRRLVRRVAPGQVVRFGNLPPILARVRHERRPVGDGCVGVVRFDSWMLPLVPQLDAALDAVRDCEGVVLDLRGNLGGVAGMIMGVAGHFLDAPLALGVLRTRAGEARFVANPRRATSAGAVTTPLAAPLAVLVDRQSASTSEFFAGGMQHLGRARVFGDTTAGQALPAATLRLPTGDVLMHVIADFTRPDGTRLEGDGVVPDQVVPLRRADLLAGRDAPLEAAVRWIVSRPTTGAAIPAGALTDSSATRSRSPAAEEQP